MLCFFIYLIKIYSMSTKGKSDLPEDITRRLRIIGEKLTKERQAVEPNYKRFAEKHGLNNMTLWRMQQGHDFSMSKLIQVLDAIGISIEDFFKGIDLDKK